MKILVINGSPKGNQSNTYRLTCAFVEGMKSAAELVEVREATVYKMTIKPCLGCFSCWNKTPGACCIQDDMAQLMKDLLWADVTIWSFPLYYFNVPGPLKNMIDRQLPMLLPFMERDTQSGGHPLRYEMQGKRTVVISTCGFYTAKGNYDGVNALFDHLCGVGNYTSIYCGQGELFRVKELSKRTDAYLNSVRSAGREFCQGGISVQTRSELDALLFPRATFEAMADASWDVEKTGEQIDESLIFTRQMAALYNPRAYGGMDIVLEMHYTDLGKRYQILLGSKGSQVLTENFQAYTTCIETPFSVWSDIASGRISGPDALMQKKYRVNGDFELMLHWDRYFGPETREVSHKAEYEKPANMNLLLIPWIVFWVAGVIHPFWGMLISLAVCALVPLIFRNNRRTIYDTLSISLVTLCAGLMPFLSQRISVTASYFFFGLMWTISGFMKLPLTAHYSMNEYGGEEALKNPLFIRTNRILTLCWGILYLLTPIWTWFLMGSRIASWTGAVNSILPLLMGFFTMWFQKWYPAKVARGKTDWRT